MFQKLSFPLENANDTRMFSLCRSTNSLAKSARKTVKSWSAPAIGRAPLVRTVAQKNSPASFPPVPPAPAHAKATRPTAAAAIRIRTKTNFLSLLTVQPYSA
jgi:hypothetical protein